MNWGNLFTPARTAFLAQTTTLLASSLDYATTLERIARLAVPFLADLCIIDVLDADGGIRRLATAHADPGREALACHIRAFTPDPDGPHPVATVLRTGTPEIGAAIDESTLARIATTAEHRALVRSLGYTSYIVVPLCARGHTLGAFSLISAESGRRYTQADLPLVEEVAHQAALAADNARLYTDSEARRLAAQALAETASLLLETLSVEAVAERVTASVQRLIGGTTAVLYRVDEAGALESIAVAGDPGPGFRHRFTIPSGVGIVGLAIRERQPVVTTDLMRDPRITLTDDVRARLATAPHQAGLGVPLLVHDHVIGGLVIGDRAGRRFTDDQAGLAQAFASQAALALENARLYEQGVRRRHEAEALAEIGRMLTASLDTHAVAQRVAESLRGLLHSSTAYLFRLVGEHLVVEALSGTVGPFRRGLTLPRRIGAAGLALREGRAVVLPNLLEDERLQYDPALRREVESAPYRSAVAVPLVVHGRPIGALVAADRLGRQFDADDVTLAQRFADQASLALHNAERYAEERERTRRLRVLAHLNQLVSSSLDSDAVLAAIARAACELMHLSIVSIWTLDAPGRSLTLRVSSDEAVPHEFPYPTLSMEQSRLGTIVSTRRPLHVPDVSTDPGFMGREWYRARGLTSFYGLPILREDRVLGVLVLSGAAPFDLGGDVEDLLRIFVTQAAAALANAQLYEQAERRRREAESIAREADEARRDAEAATRAKDEFLAVLSHELRTPLTAMLGWTRMLRSGTLDAATTTRAFETIDRNARLQAQLVEDLLDVSRIVSGNLRLDCRPVSLMGVIEAAVRAVRPAADAKGVTVGFVMTTAAADVSGDSGRLEQVIWNLLSNGVKFTPSGGRIDVSLESDGDEAIVRVRDTGRGIDPAFLPQIFDRFRQADSRITRAYGGLGLGLAIVRHLVELHHGRVTAESAGPGQGATFTVCLPRLRHAEPTETLRVPAVARRSLVDSQRSLKGVRVLIVDDEPDARDMLTVVLESRGAEITAVASARQALEALEWVRPDVIVSDIGMPDQDGYELMRNVRARDVRRGGSVPAIALTAYARGEDRQSAFAAGYQRHIAKPVDPDELADAVALLL